MHTWRYCGICAGRVILHWMILWDVHVKLAIFRFALGHTVGSVLGSALGPAIGGAVAKTCKG